MTQLLIATSTTLHALALIVFIGHYLLMSLIYLPSLTVSRCRGPRMCGFCPSKIPPLAPSMRLRLCAAAG